MASILRSSKFVRYFAGFARSIVFNSARETEGTFLQQSQCLCGNLASGFATAANSNQSLERSIKRLDQDVRRSGRISRRDIEEVLEEIRAQRSATSSQSLLVIRCCGNLVPEELPEVRTALVKEIWKTLNNLNVPMDISHYNALLRVYLENEHQFSPTEFLGDLEAKGVEPNRVTYQRLISRYCQDGDIEGATRILEFMREKQLPVNENVFNALIMGHCQADDLESAKGILAVMTQAGLEPSADTYTTLLCGYARKGDIEAIQNTLDTCDRKEIYLLDKDILDVIYALACNGHVGLVDGLIERIRKSAGYNQDAVNTILRLINKGFEDVALKILKTMPRGTRNDGEVADTGTFLIRQLVKARRPIEKVLSICKELQEKNLNSKAVLVAVESALTNGVIEMALPLLKEVKASGFPIRQHYFWPLICGASNQDEVLKILREMQDEYGLTPNAETVREYVIPNIQEKNHESAINLLRGAGVSLSTASSSCAYFALLENNLKQAAEIAANYRAFYSPGLFRKPLVTALEKTKDYESYIKFVRHLHDNIPRLENFNSNKEEEIEEDAASISSNQAEILGQIVCDVLATFRTEKAAALQKVLTGLVAQGLSISNHQAEKIQDQLGSELTGEISDLLAKLATGDLEPIPVEKSVRLKSQNSTMSVAQLEKLIGSLDEKGDNTKSLKRQLIAVALKTDDVDKVQEIIAKLEGENYILSAGVYAQLIDFYSTNNKLELALDALNKINTREPDFTIDLIKLVKMAQAFVNAGKFEEALKFLNENKRSESKIEERTFNYNSVCWKLLNTLADNGKVDELNRLFNNLLENEYIAATNVMLGPLVKVHLIKNDVEAGVKIFEEICQKYRSTPWKNELACRLIQAEDANNLQRLTDLSTDIHGEVNSLYDLVFSFVECGRIRQARKILETPGLRTRHQRINSACERYRQEGMTQSLEGLMEATKDLNHIDRAEIYYNLLLNYETEKQPEKALGLWTKMQEEDITPSDTFLIKLADFLRTSGYEVPFVVPGIQDSPKKEAAPVKAKQAAPVATKQVKERVAKPAISATLSEFRQTIKTGDIDKIMAEKTKLPETDNLSITDKSLIIEAMIKSDRLAEATKMVFELLETKNHPIPRIFRFFLNKTASAGDIATLDQIENLLSPEQKKLISFDNRYCHANIAAGKSEQYLKKLENAIMQAETPEQIKMAGEKFPRGGAAGILDKLPELAERFEEIAEKYATQQLLAPMNVLWMHYFVNDNMEAANRIWEKHLTGAPRLMFQRVVHMARDNQDDKLITKLIGTLKQAKVSEGAIGNAYSCLIDVHVGKANFEQALSVLNDAIEDVCLENINRTALLRLKEGVEKAGKQFPHQIPAKNVKAHETSSSSSSSSSDDEVHKNK